MPHDVRAQRRSHVGLTAVLLEQLPETDAAQRAPACVDEQPRRRPSTKQVATRAGLIRADPARRFVANRDDPFLATLADARDELLVQMQVAGPQGDELRDAQAGCI